MVVEMKADYSLTVQQRLSRVFAGHDPQLAGHDPQKDTS
jgi:hypothetical protein